jgi:NDP-sugar pyrophosphorylase family protein
VQFRNLINEDFLVLYADMLTNIDLGSMIESHYNKKQELESVVLTSCMQVGFSKHIHILNSHTNEILQIQQNPENQFSLLKDKIKLKKISIDFRRDLSAVDLFICTVDLLKSFK